jgi:DNA-directed RNA polymerase subunit N (RpoN/RPB10)
MLYPNCPTCGYCLADIQTNFEKKKKEICNNPDNSENDKENQIKDLVNSQELRRYCCKMRLITYIDLIELIK